MSRLTSFAADILVLPSIPYSTHVESKMLLLKTLGKGGKEYSFAPYNCYLCHPERTAWKLQVNETLWKTNQVKRTRMENQPSNFIFVKGKRTRVKNKPKQFLFVKGKRNLMDGRKPDFLRKKTGLSYNHRGFNHATKT